MRCLRWAYSGTSIRSLFPSPLPVCLCGAVVAILDHNSSPNLHTPLPVSSLLFLCHTPQAFDAYLADLSSGLANLVTFYNPDTIALGKLLLIYIRNFHVFVAFIRCICASALIPAYSRGGAVPLPGAVWSPAGVDRCQDAPRHQGPVRSQQLSCLSAARLYVAPFHSFLRLTWYARHSHTHRVTLVAAELGSDAGVVGAALLTASSAGSII